MVRRRHEPPVRRPRRTNGTVSFKTCLLPRDGEPCRSALAGEKRPPLPDSRADPGGPAGAVPPRDRQPDPTAVFVACGHLAHRHEGGGPISRGGAPNAFCLGAGGGMDSSTPTSVAAGAKTLHRETPEGRGGGRSDGCATRAYRYGMRTVWDTGLSLGSRLSPLGRDIGSPGLDASRSVPHPLTHAQGSRRGENVEPRVAWRAGACKPGFVTRGRRGGHGRG